MQMESEKTTLRGPEIVAPVDFTTETREQNAYSSDRPFKNPLLVPGVRIQFVPTSEVVMYDETEEQLGDVRDLKTVFSDVDSKLSQIFLENLTSLEIRSITDHHMFLSIDGLIFALVRETLAFSHFSKMLGVPPKYSEKSPGFLNQVNFEYWQRALNEAKDVGVGVNVIYHSKAVEGLVAPDFPDEEVFQILTIVPAKTVKQGRSKVPVAQDMAEVVPLFSRVIEEVGMVLSEHSVVPKVQAYSWGYNGLNGGVHFVRLMLDSHEYSVIVDDEVFHLSMMIESDFIGTTSKFGSVQFRFGLVRQVCSNGLVVELDPVHVNALRDAFSKEYADVKIAAGSSTPEELLVDSGAAYFDTWFRGSGGVVSVAEANSNLKQTFIPFLIKFFMDSKDHLKASLDGLCMEWGEVDPEKIVATMDRLGKRLGLPNRVLKAVILEYIAGDISGVQKLRRPMDVCNYVTYVAQAFESGRQLKLSEDGVLFAKDLKKVLVDEVEVSDTNIYQNYRAMMDEGALV